MQDLEYDDEFADLDFADLMASKGLQNKPANTRALQHLHQFCKQEEQYYSKNKPVFRVLMKELQRDGTIEPAVPVTVLCREPEGELGELYMYEVSPKSLKIDEPEHEWNATIAWFMWTFTAKQAYGLFLLSHAPESRLPPSSIRISSMTAAQIDAKHRAVRFLLTSVFANNTERLSKLHTTLGFSPWRNMVTRTQMFGLQFQTIGFVIAQIELGEEPALTSISRTTKAISEITSVSLARAALFLNPNDEAILVVEGIKDSVVVYSSVFVVLKTLFTIERNGDVFYNAPPSVSK